MTPRTPRFSNRVLIPAALLAATLIAGCVRDFGRGGTGELVIKRATLREIDAVRMDSYATTRPDRALSTQPTTRPDFAAAKVELTIEEVRQLALENNLDLRVDLLSPTIAFESLNEEQARYEAVFTTNLRYSVLDQPTASSLSGSSVKDLSVTPGIRLPLETGGDLTINAPLNRLETNNTFSTLNPAYSSDLQVQLNQPLLRGAGFETNAQRIRVAFYEYQSAEARTKLSVINVLATAERVYWRLYAARKELDVRRKEYDLAVALLEQARRRAGGGVAAEVDVIRAESGAADKLESIILAQNQLRDRQRDLKRILNKPGLEMDSPVEIVPRTDPDGVYYQLDPNQLVAAALKQRMEMIELAIRLAREAQNVDVARNDLLPLLSLTYTYNINGLGRDFSDSVSQTFDRDFQDHILGLQLEIPIGNEGARSRLRRAIAQRVQTLASQEQRIAQIKQEVYKSVDDLDANWQRILAATQRVALAARTLDAENRQFIQGLRTTTDVLNAQANLANAESSLISAITQYQISQIDVAFATGTVLGASKVVWEPMRSGAPR